MKMTLVSFSSLFASATIICNLMFISSIQCDSQDFCSSLPIGPDSPESRIIEGAEAETNEFPHQVVIFSKNETANQMCGGSILTPEFILTAAHCVARSKPENVKVVAGVRILIRRLCLRPNLGIFAKQVIIHPCYNQSEYVDKEKSSFFNDIAIIKLNHPLKLGQEIRVIKIDEKDLAQDGNRVQVIGWGRTKLDFNDTSGAYSSKLKKVTMTVNTTGFQASYSNFLERKGQVVAFQPGEFACKGDSGGPMLCDDGTGAKTNLVCGVASFVTSTDRKKGRCYGPTVFTRVFHYRCWINDVLNSVFDSKGGCIEEVYEPPGATPPWHDELGLSLLSSSSFPRLLPTIFTHGICITLIFLSAWGNQFF